VTLWLTFYVAPLVYGAQFVAMYALVPWACASQHHAALHGINAAALAVCLAATIRAFLVMKSQTDGSDDSSAGLIARRRFVALLGAWISTLVCIALAAQWLTVWIIPPCVS
jgi:uncharacterized membrane protein YadS